MDELVRFLALNAGDMQDCVVFLSPRFLSLAYFLHILTHPTNTQF